MNLKVLRKPIDGGYLIVGQTDAVDSMGDVWVVKTNDAGEAKLAKNFWEL